MPRISGVEFDDAWRRRVNVAIDDSLMVPFVSLQNLLSAKISPGRAQDSADIVALRESVGREGTGQHRTAADALSPDASSNDNETRDAKKESGPGVDDEFER